VPPSPEVLEVARRRRFTPEYKLRILREVAACREGEIGALLRREGLYASHLASWRRTYAKVGETGMKSQKRGPQAKEVNPLAKKLAELERENRRLQRKVEKQEAIIDFQKKVHELLGIPLKNHDSDGSD
jgi:transposase